ncbi:MAG TPA: FecR domain-containing protein [Steroidobacteraceae bacterium]|jgi:transmembrane sensor
MSERTPADEAAGWVLRLQEPSANAETFLAWQRWLATAPENRIAFEQVEETLLRLSSVDAKPELPSVAEMAADTYDGSVPVSEFLARRQAAYAEAAGVPFGYAAGNAANHPHGGADSEVPDLEARRRMNPAATASGKKRVDTRLRYAMAAGLAVAVIGGWLGVNAIRESQQGVFAYSTAPGQRKDFTLPDGSRITLDADSALNVELTSRQRSLRLARGEAFFQVSKDPSRPFIVSAGGARVRAVGTEFNVRMGDHRTVVAVVEGIVQVAAHSEPPRDPYAAATRAPAREEQLRQGTDEREDDSSVQLVAQVEAGQAVAYAGEGGLQKLPAAEASLATSWLGGRRQYRNEPLQYVLADIDRYTGRRIEVADAETGALKFTGTLNLENSNAWLKGLSIALPVTVTQKADGTLLVSLEATSLRSVRPSSSTAPIASSFEGAAALLRNET